MRAARHPLRLGTGRRLAEADLERHVADLVRLVLLTGPGERLHRPDFGAGLGAQALFSPLDRSLAGLVEMRIRGSLDQALADSVEVIDVQLETPGQSTLTAAVAYRLRPAGAAITTEVRVVG